MRKYNGVNKLTIIKIKIKLVFIMYNILPLFVLKIIKSYKLLEIIAKSLDNHIIVLKETQQPLKFDNIKKLNNLKALNTIDFKYCDYIIEEYNKAIAEYNSIFFN